MAIIVALILCFIAALITFLINEPDRWSGDK